MLILSNWDRFVLYVSIRIGRPYWMQSLRDDRRAHRRADTDDCSAGWRPIDEIAQRGVPILLVEQKLSIAMRISHCTYVMGHGRIVFEGTQFTDNRNTAKLSISSRVD
jgi:hypothetical protein